MAKVFEPKAPAPSQRLAALHAAKGAGLHVYAARAPTYPECDEADLRATLQAVAELEPITIFHEPINIRAENVARIQAQAESLGVRLKTEVFDTRERWQEYALNALQTVERLAKEPGVAGQLHLWLDESLGRESSVNRWAARGSFRTPHSELRVRKWLQRWWDRVIAWPK